MALSVALGLIDVFERFTDRARRATVLAQDESRMLNHNYIGTEHILLGLIHEGEGIACQVLREFTIDLEGVRNKILTIIGAGTERTQGHIPFTPRAKKVLELSLREALQMGHNYIGTEHILLGIVREGEGVGAQVLTSYGITLDEIRKAVIAKLTGYQKELTETVLGPPPEEPTEPTEPTAKDILDSFQILLLPQADAGDLRSVELLLKVLEMKIKLHLL